MDMHGYVYVYVYLFYYAMHAASITCVYTCMHAYLNGHGFVHQVRVYCTNFSRGLPSRLTTLSLVVSTWYKTAYIEDKSYVLEVSEHD